MSTRVVAVAGGGTAGHVFPSLAVASVLEAEGDLGTIFLGSRDRLEGQLVPAAGHRFEHVEAIPLPRRLSPRLVAVPFQLQRAIKRCVEILTTEQVVGVVTFGGYVSFPVNVAARRLGLPLVIHEQNSVPGIANRLASGWADRVAVTYPGSADSFRHPERTAVTGNPVRKEMLSASGLDRAAARESFGLKPDVPTLLVFGGSQGARALNRAIVASAPHWGDLQVQILHAAGAALHREAAADWEKARRDQAGLGVRCVDFIDDMAAAYAAADVVVCRAGATSIAELTVQGKPSVLVPYPHATADHQRHNAEALARVGAARMILDDELTGERIAAEVRPLLEDGETLHRMIASSRSFGRADAADAVARLLRELLPEAA
ncbi:MAG: undecaprenyldiphospho-muramoylpentapeptide beta-N-acetylglucosaminyltransferase [Nitriliruptorales bacterium]|nr:undecaprenyldiphospho-muramoylpentapeptide beta-N-acetylglucosaminyltransferase [Nitriliruptorales bacterium]